MSECLLNDLIPHLWLFGCNYLYMLGDEDASVTYQIHEFSLQAFVNAKSSNGKLNQTIKAQSSYGKLNQTVKAQKRELIEKNLELEPLSDKVHSFPGLHQFAFSYASDCFGYRLYN